MILPHIPQESKMQRRGWKESIVLSQIQKPDFVWRKPLQMSSTSSEKVEKTFKWFRLTLLLIHFFEKMYQYPPRRLKWDDNTHKLLTFTYPELSNHHNRKYQIMIRYLDGDKVKNKHVYFGLDYFVPKISGGNGRAVRNRKRATSPLHPFFWE